MSLANTSLGFNRNLIGGKRSSHTINAVLDLNATISDQIASILENMSFSAIESLDKKTGEMISLVSNFFGKNSTENPEKTAQIHELLKDHHSTFSLFEQSIIAACEVNHSNTLISIDLYKRDINNPNYITTLEKAIQSGIDPKLIILEIRADDYGLIDSKFIENLKKAKKIGFSFSIYDFILVENEIRVTNLIILVKEKVYPKFIKITKEIYNALLNPVTEIAKDVKKCFDKLKEAGAQFIESHNPQREYGNISSHGDIPTFFRNSTIEKESILKINGEEYGKELLIRFGEGVTVPEGLEELKKHRMTMLLVEKMLKSGIEDIFLGEKRSINIYIKDLGERDFAKKILTIADDIPKVLRKNLIFEILEYNYGALSERVIENIQFLQKKGFSVAIDDLHLNENHKGISKELLEIFMERNIFPDIIKIDGHHIQKICSMNTCDDSKTKKEIKRLIHHLKEVIGYYSLLPKPPKYIAEWIQDTDEAIKIKKILGITTDDLLFQGRNIQSGSFGFSSIG